MHVALRGGLGIMGALPCRPEGRLSRIVSGSMKGRAVRFWRAMVVGVVLAGCVPEPAPVPVPGPLVMGQEAVAACAAQGGQVVRGLAGETCARPEPDAGQACTQNSDCSGMCLASSSGAAGGSCSPVTPFFGCHSVLVAPGQVAGLCVD